MRAEKGRKEGWRTAALLLVIMQLGHCVFDRERDKAERGLLRMMDEARTEISKVQRKVNTMPADADERQRIVKALENLDDMLNVELPMNGGSGGE